MESAMRGIQPLSKGVAYYPQTCPKCPFRGERKIVGDMIPIRQKEGPLEGQYEWFSIGWPERCKSCNARAQARKRARNSIRSMESIRCYTEAFRPTERQAERWKYLKFVTLTWKNESVTESEPDMKSARLWLARKRKKIASKLDAIAGTDVLECVTTKQDDGKYHHHVHSHGVWVMPSHPIKRIEGVMRKYSIGRDQVRACLGKWITPKIKVGDEWVETGEEKYWMEPAVRAGVYLSKYLTKQKGAKRGSWGLCRGVKTSEDYIERWSQMVTE